MHWKKKAIARDRSQQIFKKKTGINRLIDACFSFYVRLAAHVSNG